MVVGEQINNEMRENVRARNLEINLLKIYPFSVVLIFKERDRSKNKILGPFVPYIKWNY